MSVRIKSCRVSKSFRHAFQSSKRSFPVFRFSLSSLLQHEQPPLRVNSTYSVPKLTVYDRSVSRQNIHDTSCAEAVPFLCDFYRATSLIFTTPSTVLAVSNSTIVCLSTMIRSGNGRRRSAEVAWLGHLMQPTMPLRSPKCFVMSHRWNLRTVLGVLVATDTCTSSTVIATLLACLPSHRFPKPATPSEFHSPRTHPSSDTDWKHYTRTKCAIHPSPPQWSSPWPV